MCKGNPRGMDHALQITEEGILRERELFWESLAECHYLTSGKTIQHRSGFLGLASEAILLMKNKRKNQIQFIRSADIWRSCYLLGVPWFSECRSSSVSEVGYPRRQWDKVPAHGPRQAHWPQRWQECCPLALLYHQGVSIRGLPGGASGKEPACQWGRHKRRGFHLWVWKIPWRRAWQPTPVFLSGESHGKGSLVGYGP